MDRANGPWLPEELEGVVSINHLEIAAGTRTLRVLGSQWLPPGTRVVWMSDNLATMYAVNAWRSTRLTKALIEVREVAENLKIYLEVRHTPGVENGEADALSREGLKKTGVENPGTDGPMHPPRENPIPPCPTRRTPPITPRRRPDPPEYSLNPLTLQQALATLQVTPEIDAFASKRTSKCRRFWALWEGQGEEAVDALDQDWRNRRILAYPPLQLIPQALQKAMEPGAETVLICPPWRTQIWWPTLISTVRKWTVAFPARDIPGEKKPFELHLLLPGEGPLPPPPPECPLLFCLLQGGDPPQPTREAPPPLLSLGGKMSWQISEIFS
jgi:hypothetical protein